MADRNQEMSKENEKEAATVQNYLSSHNIPAQKTEKGTFVLVKEAGSGPRADSGKEVSIRYTGMSLPSMQVFQSNMTGPGNEPFKFVVGQHRAIPGMDDGIRQFHKGGKGSLYIPAYLGYGEQALPGHKPYENLAFDIEVIDVTDAPPPAPNSGLQGMPQGVNPGGAQQKPAMRTPPQQH